MQWWKADGFSGCVFDRSPVSPSGDHQGEQWPEWFLMSAMVRELYGWPGRASATESGTFVQLHPFFFFESPSSFLTVSIIMRLTGLWCGRAEACDRIHQSSALVSNWSASVLVIFQRVATLHLLQSRSYISRHSFYVFDVFVNCFSHCFDCWYLHTSPVNSWLVSHCVTAWNSVFS